MHVRLNPDYTVNMIDATGNALKEKEASSWSMVYNQGFFINVSGSRFVANFKHTIKDSVTNYSQLLASDASNFDSKCNQTMVGVLQHGGTQYQCAFAVQD
jgi:hypothetical protein